MPSNCGQAPRLNSTDRNNEEWRWASYIAGSATAVTLAVAGYLFYLRRLREGCEDHDCMNNEASTVQEERSNPDVASQHAASPGLLDKEAADAASAQATPPFSSSFSWLLGGISTMWGRCPSAQQGRTIPLPGRNPTPAAHIPAQNGAVEALNTAGNRQEQGTAADPTGFQAVPAGGDAGWRGGAAAAGPGGEQAADDDDAELAADARMDADAAAGGEQHEAGDEGAGPGIPWRELLDQEEEDDLDVPDDYRDPISLNVMLDPVVLCATGQVYEYTTLRNWFRTGNRLCPKTNIEVLDVQVVRLPWLKARIHEWLRQHGREPAPQPDPVERLARLHPSVASWVHAVRNDTGERRSTALADLYELLRQWEASTVDPPEGQLAGAAEEALAALGPGGGAAYAGAMERLHKYVRGAVVEEAIWLLRHGNPYLQGVAASILAYCDTPGEVSWLAATAAVPAVSLCMSQNRYTSQAATRLLYNLARGGQVARRALVGAGAVTALISVLATDRVEYGYCRDRAAATLALLIRDADGKSLLLRYGLRHLVAMVGSGLDRWEQRDAATVLLKLGLEPEELRGLGLSSDDLVSFWCCSRAWLEGLVDEPTKGYMPAEKQARQAVLQLQSGTLTHAALAGFIADQDADLDLANPLDDSDDPWDDSAHPSEEAAAAWHAVESTARRQLQAAAESTLAERQAAEERRRRDSVAAGLAAAAAAAAGAADVALQADGQEEEDDDEGSESEGDPDVSDAGADADADAQTCGHATGTQQGNGLEQEEEEDGNVEAGEGEESGAAEGVVEPDAGASADAGDVAGYGE